MSAVDATPAAAPAAEVAKAVIGIQLNDPREGKEGQSIARRQLCRELFQGVGVEKPMSRGLIVKYLAEKCNHTTSHQVVFQATQGLEQNGEVAANPRSGGGGGGGTQKTINVPVLDEKGQPTETRQDVGQRDYIYELFKSGRSRRAVQDFLKQYGIELSYGAIFQYSKKYKEAGGNVTVDAKGGGKGAAAAAAISPDQAQAALAGDPDLDEEDDDGGDDII
jgi:hypothetical protein